MRRVEFVNRIPDLAYLNFKAESMKGNNHIIMIGGANGIGKSELTRKFCLEVSIPAIKVEIQQNKGKGYIEGYYIRKIGKAFHEYSLKDKRLISLNSYLKNMKSTILNRRILQAVIDESKNIRGGGIIKEVAERFTKQGILSPKVLFESDYSESLSIVEDYISRQLQSNNIIVNIENIQDVDDTSREILRKIISNTAGSLFIFEYTENTNNKFAISDFIDLFYSKSNIDIEIYNLAPLTLDDVKKIFYQNPDINADIIQTSFVNYTGNLRPIRDIFAMVAYYSGNKTSSNPKFFEFEKASESHLRLISKSELFLLTLILAHGEPFDLTLLKYLSKFNESFPYIIDIHSTVKALAEQDLIKLQSDQVGIFDDSIADVLIKINQDIAFVELCYKYWLVTYDTFLTKDDLFISNSIRLQRVLYFASLLNQDAKIYSLLDEISYQALLSRAPRKMMTYVEEIRDKLIKKIESKNQVLKLNNWLIELYCKLGIPEPALKIIDLYPNPSKSNKIVKAIILEQLGMQNDAIQFINNELVDSNSLPLNYILGLKIIRLVSLYDIGLYDKSREEFFELVKNPAYQKLFELGFLLRNAELIVSYEESLSYFIESIKVFEKFGAKHQAAFSRIGYGVHLAILGKLTKAREQFNIAEDELSDIVTERHTLLNNQAVLLLFEKNLGSEVEELLRHAITTAEMDFDRITILINYLVLMDWRNDNVEVEKVIYLIEKILKNPSFSNKDIIRFAYYNIYKFYEKVGKTPESAIYFKKIHDLTLPETPIWKYWLYNEPLSINDEEYFRTTINRPISFLTHWNIDFDSKLMHY